MTFCELMSVPQAGVVNARAVTARSLFLDRLAVEVGANLADAGVRALVLKGAAIATWLYDDGGTRPYGDADLLVSPSDFARAEGVLAEVGFVLRRPGLSPLEETDHGRMWGRQESTVDLHRSVWGVGVGPTRAWTVLTRDTEVLHVGGGDIEVLGLPARALHVALHAVQHGAEAKPRQDLVRAGSRVSLDTWRQAAELARALEAEGAMAAGLRLDPLTAPLADELGLSYEVPLQVALRADGAPLCALGLARLVPNGGLRARGALAARLLIPTPERLRIRYPFAARGPAALSVAYVRRTVSLVVQARAAVVAVRRARKPVSAGAGRSRA